jgi:hypothetical protein
MTAEVAILNQQAVALAADSAVTIGGNNVPKIYPSANKLFTLSKYAPVGVMVYSSANFMGVAWEIILKTYRQQLGQQTFSRLEDYAENLLAFIEANDAITPRNQEQRYTKNLIRSLFEMVNQHVRSQTQKEQTSDAEVLSALVDRLHQEWSAKPVFARVDGTELDGQSVDMVNQLSEEVAASIFPVLFPELPVESPTYRKLQDLGAISINHMIDESPFPGTGLVIAGYGEDDLFPAVATFRLETKVNGNLKHQHETRKSARIDFEKRAAIVPFAQSDMVATFIEGADPEYQRLVDTQMKNALDELFRSIAEDVLDISEEDPAQKVLQELSGRTWDRIKNELDTARRDKFVNPLLDILISLPKTELASMAESLVSLTSLKRRLSDSAETVGGPVDVALISKGDGFIWIDRKHYFSPELNRQFFANYFREAPHETQS